MVAEPTADGTIRVAGGACRCQRPSGQPTAWAGRPLPPGAPPAAVGLGARLAAALARRRQQKCLDAVDEATLRDVGLAHLVPPPPRARLLVWPRRESLRQLYGLPEDSLPTPWSATEAEDGDGFAALQHRPPLRAEPIAAAPSVTTGCPRAAGFRGRALWTGAVALRRTWRALAAPFGRA